MDAIPGDFMPGNSRWRARGEKTPQKVTVFSRAEARSPSFHIREVFRADLVDRFAKPWFFDVASHRIRITHRED
jgi:hypothetical protein